LEGMESGCVSAVVRRTGGALCRISALGLGALPVRAVPRPGRLAFLLILGLLPVWTGAAGPSRAETIRVVYTDGRDQERLPVWTVDGTSYLSVNDVGRIFNATKQWQSALKRLVLWYAGSQATLTVESPVVLVGKENRQMRSPVRLRRGVVEVPLELVTDVLPDAAGLFASWNPATSTLRVGDVERSVGSLRIRRLTRGVRTTLTLTEPLQYDFDSEAAGGYKLRLRGARGEPERLSRTLRRGLVRRVDATRVGDDIEVLFIPAVDDVEARVLRHRDPDRVVVDITAPQGTEVPEPPLKPRWALAPDEVLGREGEDGAVGLVVIDPGHGGIDTGARGPSGLQEKDVVLDIARRLEVLLEDNLGIDAVLTREVDEFMPLRARTEMGNALEADLFLSIHSNASRRPEVGGFEVYFQSLEMGEEEQLVAEFENAVLELEGNAEAVPDSDVPFILWDMAQNAFMAESSELAENVQEALGERISIKNRGVKQANFVVLRGAYMPAVLLECGFTTNEGEEALLGDPEFRQALAEGIYRGVARFKARVEERR